MVIANNWYLIIGLAWSEVGVASSKSRDSKICCIATMNVWKMAKTGLETLISEWLDEFSWLFAC